MICPPHMPSTPECSTTLACITDPELADYDHLRLLHEVIRSIPGEAAQVLAALNTAAGKGQSYRTFAELQKIADVAMVPLRSVKRIVKKSGPLVQEGWLRRIGRRGHRTVTYELTPRSIQAFKTNKYGKLPRAVVHALKSEGTRLTWSERVILSLLFSRHSLFLHGMDDKYCEDSVEHMRRLTTRAVIEITGLSRRSISETRQRLLAEDLIVFDDDGMYLNDEYCFGDFSPPPSAIKVLGTPNIRRIVKRARDLALPA